MLSWIIVIGILVLCSGWILFVSSQQQEGFSTSAFEVPNLQKEINERVIHLQKKVKQLQEYYENMDEKTPLLNDYTEQMIL